MMKTPNITQNIKLLIFYCSLLFLLSGCCGAFSPIDADDIGVGKTVKLPIRPDGSDVFDEKINGMSVPKWKDTGLYLIGGGLDSNGERLETAIQIQTIQGKWYPWGKSSQISDKECKMITCGDAQGYGGCDFIADKNTPIVSSVYTNIGCYLPRGHGIYLLISKGSNDPNESVQTAVAPTASRGFYTTHISNFISDTTNTTNVNKFYSCEEDRCDPVDINKLVGGKVFVKILDTYYDDNETDNSNRTIDIKFKGGIYEPNFVSVALKTLNGQIKHIQNKLQDEFINSLNNTMRVIILFYFVMTFAGFMIGLIKITQTEAVVRLLKIAIVIMLVTPSNHEFIQENFINFYEKLATFVSNKVAQSISGSSISIDSGQVKDLSTDNFGDQIGYLAQYDAIVNSITSSVVHKKIFALLFTEKIFYIPLLYILVFIIIAVVLRSMLLYILAYVQIAVLVIILPIFGVLLLFKVTSDMFQSWLKSIANSTIMIVVATLGIGITLNMMYKMLGDLLYYSVSCHNFFWFMGWIMPDDMSAVQEHLNATTYCLALFTALICYSFISEIPKLADSLSDSQLSPTANAFASAWHGINSLLQQGISSVKDINSKYLMGRLIDRIHREGYDAEDKEGKGVLDKWKTMRSKVDYLLDNKYTRLINPNEKMDSARDISKQMEIARMEGYDSEKLTQKYTDLIAERRADLNNQLNAANAGADQDYRDRIQGKLDSLQKIEEKLEKIKRE